MYHGSEYFQFYMATMDRTLPMVSKLLRDLAAWFHPAPGCATVERIFGDVNAEASDAVFRFG
jgi:hypothetical protein